MTNRRKFIVQCTKTVAAAALLPGALNAGVSTGLPVPDQLSLDIFARHLRTSFAVYGCSSAPVELELIEAKPWAISGRTTSPGQEARHETFVLRFRGPGDRQLAQSTYVFAHEVMGRFAMFIVPDTHTFPGQHRYEAVFTRMNDRTKSLNGRRA